MDDSFATSSHLPGSVRRRRSLFLLHHFTLVYVPQRKECVCRGGQGLGEGVSLTRLYVGDSALVVESAGEKPTPTGGPAGVAHGSPVAGVDPQAAAALHCVPHLPPAHKTRQDKDKVALSRPDSSSDVLFTRLSTPPSRLTGTDYQTSPSCQIRRREGDICNFLTRSACWHHRHAAEKKKRHKIVGMQWL